MSRVNICDSCGEQMEVKEAVYFEVNFIARKPGGGGVLPQGAINVDWSQRDAYGDLCDECAEPIIKELDKIL